MTYETSFNVRKIDGDGICFFNRIRAGTYDALQDQVTLYNIVAGKNYFESIGPVSLDLCSLQLSKSHANYTNRELSMYQAPSQRARIVPVFSAYVASSVHVRVPLLQATMAGLEVPIA